MFKLSKRASFVIAAAVIVVLAVFGSVYASVTYHLASLTLSYVGYVGEFLETHNGAVTAIATVFIAAFTIVLALVTNRQAKLTKITAEAAKLSAEAAIGVELPIISLNQIQLNKQQGGVTTMVAGHPGLVSTLAISFKNFGRTNAELTTLCVEWAVVQKLPNIPIYKASYPYSPGTFIEAGQKSAATLQLTITLQPDEVAAIADETKFLWIFGYLLFNDFLGKSHNTRFCAKWQPYVLQPDGALRAMGFVHDSQTPPQYTQRT